MFDFMLIGGMVERLQVLKRKAEESIFEELGAAYVCKRRLDHLKEFAAGPPAAATTTDVVATSGSSPNNANATSSAGPAWRRRRLDRMLVEYFLRKGYYGTATRLANTSDLNNLTNIGNF